MDPTLAMKAVWEYVMYIVKWYKFEGLVPSYEDIGNKNILIPVDTCARESMCAHCTL